MAPAYDLFVLLDPETPEDRRTELVAQVRSQIDSGATLKGDADWGMRRLSYEIDHRREAQYHLFQFEASPEVLNQLDRSLSIEDAVLRHRIIRLPGDAPETTPGPGEEPPPRRSDERGPRDGGRERRDEEAPAVETPAEAAPAETPVEAPAEESAKGSAEAATEAAPEEPAPAAEAETPAEAAAEAAPEPTAPPSEPGPAAPPADEPA
jgi:small subunit ribosomal protein S6